MLLALAPRTPCAYKSCVDKKDHLIFFFSLIFDIWSNINWQLCLFDCGGSIYFKGAHAIFIRDKSPGNLHCPPPALNLWEQGRRFTGPGLLSNWLRTNPGRWFPYPHSISHRICRHPLPSTWKSASSLEASSRGLFTVLMCRLCTNEPVLHYSQPPSMQCSCL